MEDIERAASKAEKFSTARRETCAVAKCIGTIELPHEGIEDSSDEIVLVTVDILAHCWILEAKHTRS